MNRLGHLKWLGHLNQLVDSLNMITPFEAVLSFDMAGPFELDR